MGNFGGTNEKGSVNVELNIVPFIDLMSCLTAFLLVTAVWVNLSSLENEPVGRASDGIKKQEPARLAVLLEHDQIIVQATPSGETRKLAAFDWERLEVALRELELPGESQQVEIAAVSSDTHPIAYRHLIAAMDSAVKVGYPRVGITDPINLAR